MLKNDFPPLGKLRDGEHCRLPTLGKIRDDFSNVWKQLRCGTDFFIHCLENQVMTNPKEKEAIPLPMTRREMAARGWNELDVLMITGDAYVDHPAFGAA
ncbi:MAG TPA: hypothetical protein VJ904_04530, partial [Tichowtungia sp.]|nr:hypothetical protein [Tichowtungia sp.]